MKDRRILPCLDTKDGKVVKGTEFINLKEIADPATLAKIYEDQGAQELVVLDIAATLEERKTRLNLVRDVAKVLTIPFTLGGGIASLEDMENILAAGASKVSLNSAAVKNKKLLEEGAKRFGREKIVIAIDAKRNARDTGWEVYIRGGKENTGMDLIEWAKEAVEAGAGEILLTSIDADGTKKGYDIPMLRSVKAAVDVAVIASGGCGKLEDFAAVFENNAADAALAASVFHYGLCTVGQVQEYLKEKIPYVEEAPAGPGGVQEDPNERDSAHWIDRLEFDKQGGLLPVIVQEEDTKEVLMLAYMNKESLQITLEKGRACYYSRSRKKLWLKGEESGHFQEVKEIWRDCDNDTLLLRVHQVGGSACHTGAKSCFYRQEKLMEDGNAKSPVV